MAGRGVDRLALACRRPVAQAVVRCAEVRAALRHAPRDLSAGFIRAVALSDRLGRTRVAGRTTPALSRANGRGIEVGGPLPDVAGHVVEPVTVRRVAGD